MDESVVDDVGASEFVEDWGEDRVEDDFPDDVSFHFGLPISIW